MCVLLLLGEIFLKRQLDPTDWGVDQVFYNLWAHPPVSEQEVVD